MDYIVMHTAEGLLDISRQCIRFMISVLVFLTVVLGVSLCGNEALAQDHIWEVNIGGGYAGELDDEWVHNSYPTHFDHGFTLMASAGYRFTNWFSLNLEQSFIRGYSRSDINHEGEEGVDSSYENWSYGETCITVKFIYWNEARDFDLYLKLGAGMIYGTKYHSRDSRYYGDDVSFILWSIPMGVGGNYYFTEMFGVGFDVQYDMVFVWGEIKATAHLAMRF